MLSEVNFLDKVEKVKEKLHCKYPRLDIFLDKRACLLLNTYYYNPNLKNFLNFAEANDPQALLRLLSPRATVMAGIVDEVVVDFFVFSNPRIRDRKQYPFGQAKIIVQSPVILHGLAALILNGSLKPTIVGGMMLALVKDMDRWRKLKNPADPIRVGILDGYSKDVAAILHGKVGIEDVKNLSKTICMLPNIPELLQEIIKMHRTEKKIQEQVKTIVSLGIRDLKLEAVEKNTPCMSRPEFARKLKLYRNAFYPPGRLPSLYNETEDEIQKCSRIPLSKLLNLVRERWNRDFPRCKLTCEKDLWDLLVLGPADFAARAEASRKSNPWKKR
jgi:hypothetical protein